MCRTCAKRNEGRWYEYCAQLHSVPPYQRCSKASQREYANPLIGWALGGRGIGLVVLMRSRWRARGPREKSLWKK